MSRFDTVRRGVSLVLAVFCLLVVPELASAQFSGQSSVSQAVGTVSLSAPTNVRGSFDCNLGWGNESVAVTVSAFDAGAAPADTRYVYTLKSPRSAAVTKTAAGPTTLNATQGLDGDATAWTISIQPVLGSWTGPSSTTKVQCNWLGTNAGTF